MNKFSEEELDWYFTLYGMLQEGMCEPEALSALRVMDCPAGIYTDLFNILLTGE